MNSMGQDLFKLDLRTSYHQIKVMPKNREKIAFHIYDGHYEFLEVFFRLTNTPFTLQGLMNELFRTFLTKFFIVFYDILV